MAWETGAGCTIGEKMGDAEERNALTDAKHLAALTDEQLARCARLTRRTLLALVSRERKIIRLLQELDRFGQAVQRLGGTRCLPRVLRPGLRRLLELAIPLVGGHQKLKRKTH